jgi:hypothetical protein
VTSIPADTLNTIKHGVEISARAYALTADLNAIYTESVAARTVNPLDSFNPGFITSLTKPQLMSVISFQLIKLALMSVSKFPFPNSPFDLNTLNWNIVLPFSFGWTINTSLVTPWS